jgi:site-specific recombinase XerD
LRARNRSPRTIDSYVQAVEQLAEHARAAGAETLDKALIEDWLAGLHERLAPATVAQRYRSLQQVTKWLTAEGELDADRCPACPRRRCPRRPCRSCRPTSCALCSRPATAPGSSSAAS